MNTNEPNPAWVSVPEGTECGGGFKQVGDELVWFSIVAGAHTLEERLHHCTRCNGLMLVDETDPDDSLCGWCRHMLEKSKEE
jgi:hypothetical protein